MKIGPLIEIGLIDIKWSCYNSFALSILYLNLTHPFIESSLFAINIHSTFLYIDLFWMRIKIFDKTDKTII